jgi:hypothetical protein
VKAEPLFDFEDQRSRWDIELGGRLARRTWSSPSTPLWDKDLALYTWYEYDFGSGASYLMDSEGRYRTWHRGEWIVKIPRAPRPGRWRQRPFSRRTRVAGRLHEVAGT